MLALPLEFYCTQPYMQAKLQNYWWEKLTIRYIVTNHYAKIFVKILPKSSFFAFFQGNKERTRRFLTPLFFTTKNSINLLPHAHVFWAWARILRINHSNLCKVIRKPQSRFAFLYNSWFFWDDWSFCKITKMFWRTILTTPRVRPYMYV